MEDLIDELIESNYLRTPEIVRAFQKIGRRNFLPEELDGDQDMDIALPIGHGATISQPRTVAFMLELLQPKSGQTILDIGSGSCWTTALLAEIVGPTGRIFGIERVSELKEFGAKNLERYHFNNVSLLCQDGSNGLPEAAPFDRILVSVAANEIPDELFEQLKSGGRLVIPTVEMDLYLIRKEITGTRTEESFPGFAFVPLIED